MNFQPETGIKPKFVNTGGAEQPALPNADKPEPNRRLGFPA